MLQDVISLQWVALKQVVVEVQQVVHYLSQVLQELVVQKVVVSLLQVVQHDEPEVQQDLDEIDQIDVLRQELEHE